MNFECLLLKMCIRDRLDTLTISENIALALTINKVPAGEVDGRVREMAGKLNITDIPVSYTHLLSRPIFAIMNFS